MARKDTLRLPPPGGESAFSKYMGRPRAFDSAKQLDTFCKEYIDIWEGMARPTTVIGLCCYLGISQPTLWEYENGLYDHIDDFSITVKKHKGYIQMDKVEKALNGQYHAGFTQFNLQMEHGQTPKTVIETITKPTDENKLEGENLKLALEKRGLPTDIFKT
jgi:hypothetical protein